MQNIKNSLYLSPGMSKADVVDIMGEPVKNEFNKNVEEWHYCSTGQMADDYLAVFFYNGKVVATKNYTVTLSDVGGAWGSCEKFIKRGNYKVY